jgi:hypothetical protein
MLAHREKFKRDSFPFYKDIVEPLRKNPNPGIAEEAKMFRVKKDFYAIVSSVLSGGEVGGSACDREGTARQETGGDRFP